ncbi:iron-containing alcohol dehydrogenase [Janthinobacterium sp. PC23-8]|uniref:iron-containing alcohol dehydrogenase n=1 Tax=Janthinobacterium sp. PC23-8 TaxID=2012679 RepID=UPI000B97A343|nr:iron-containing alcohol dehydrogenase [Janthinobacterium sp. PC23-8]OYO31584.1 alcohol dehydrogenase [Janthinobacterium sp. PC23-8]
MSAFQFRTVPHLISEPGASSELGTHVRQHFPAVRRALLVTDPGFLATGLVATPLRSLRDAGIEVQVFSDVQADPPEAVVLAAVEQATLFHVELVIGLGGGSSMDVAKLIAVLAPGQQTLADMYGIGKVQGARLPLVQLPTTAGTGSEVTNIAIVTTGAASKMGVVAAQLYADLAILDASLTLGLPPAVTAATGIDAMVHAIEAYTTAHLKNPLSDMLARQALSLLSANLVRVCRNGDDLAARQAMLLGAMLAGQAFSNAPVAAVHALAYPIGAMFHVPHGLSNALVMPHVLRFNLSHATPMYAELAAIVAPQASGSEEARAQGLIAALQALAVETGIVRTLREVGVAESELDALAEAAMLQTRLLGNNPRIVTVDDARAIYAAAW